MSKTWICLARFLTAGEILMPLFCNLAPLYTNDVFPKAARDTPRPLCRPSRDFD